MSPSAEVEAARKELLADIRARMPQFLDRLTWPQSKLREERQRLLRDLVRTAKEKSAWHRKRLRDVDPDTLREEDLPRIVPVMTKADLMKNWDDIVTDDRITLDLAERHLEEHGKELTYLFGEFVVASSGGSSGQRGVFVYPLKCAPEAALRSAPRFIRWHAARFDLRLPEIETIGYVGAGGPVHLTVAANVTLSNPALKFILVDIRRPLDEVVAELNRIKPVRFQGYPSALRILADEAEAGRLQIDPILIISEAEPLYPQVREAIESAWPDAPIFNAYGSSETAWIAVSCGVRPGGTLHLIEDGVVLEPVAADGTPVKPGTPASKVFVTNLINPLLPLIRYELTDRLTVLDEPDAADLGRCPCGCTFRRISDVRGRLEDVFLYAGADERKVSVDVDVFETPLNEYRNIVQYQVRQTPNGAKVLIVSKGDVAMDKVRSDIQRGLGDIGLKNPRVSVKLVSALERTRMGKAKRYVPLSGEEAG